MQNTLIKRSARPLNSSIANGVNDRKRYGAVSAGPALKKHIREKDKAFLRPKCNLRQSLCPLPPQTVTASPSCASFPCGQAVKYGRHQNTPVPCRRRQPASGKQNGGRHVVQIRCFFRCVLPVYPCRSNRTSKQTETMLSVWICLRQFPDMFSHHRPRGCPDTDCKYPSALIPEAAAVFDPKEGRKACKGWRQGMSYCSGDAK